VVTGTALVEGAASEDGRTTDWAIGLKTVAVFRAGSVVIYVLVPI
jgi:hypothetical protein